MIFENLAARLKAYIGAGELRAKVLRGGAWLGAGTASAQFFRFGRNVILARILAPESFGAMAIVLSVSSLMDTFTEIGTREAVIQNPSGDRRSYLNSAWWFAAARGCLSYALIFLAAPFVAELYRNQQLNGLIRVALLGVIFRGLMSPRAFVALKRLDYKHWAMLQYGSSIAGTLITIMLALAIRNVWALAIGFAAEYAVLCLLSYALFPFRPDIAFQRRSSQELLQFSKSVFGLSFLNLIYVRADVLVLGKLIPPDQLGIYAIAIYLAQAPAVFLLNYQGEILMPVFSHLQREPRATNAVLQHGVSLLLLAGLPLIVFVALSGRTLLSLLYGARYEPGYWPFLIALVVALINIGNAQLTTTFYAAGKPQLHRVCLFAMALLMVGCIYPAAKFLGTTGAQLTALAAMIVGYAIQLRQAGLLTGFRISVEKSRVIQIAGPALVLGVACYLRSWIGQLTPGFDLLFGAAAALTALLAASAGLLRPHRNVTTVSTTAAEFRGSN